MTAPAPRPWRSFLAAWLGWTFDGLDGLLYVLIAGPFVARLIDKPVTDPEVPFKVGLIQAFFLFGWSVGGAVFGRLGDRLGRARTLTITILVYALFTGASSLATEWWHLLIFRFIAALGIGGEWAAGSALVAETLHPRHRAWASAALQSGYMVGIMLAAWTVGLFRHSDPRWVFVVGIAPALATVWIRRSVPEPPEWRAAAGRAALPPVRTLFGPALIRTTLLTLALTSIALTAVWAFITFGPQAVQQMPEVVAWNDPARARALIMRLTFFWASVNIAGNFFATYLARALGYRLALVILLVGSGASLLIGYRRPPTLDNIYTVYAFIAFFALGLFGVFPLYVPALFPTLVRTLGAGVCYNTGRIIAGLGVIGAGTISRQSGGPAGAIWWISLLYIPSLLIAAFMPEISSEARPGSDGEKASP